MTSVTNFVSNGNLPIREIQILIQTQMLLSHGAQREALCQREGGQCLFVCLFCLFVCLLLSHGAQRESCVREKTVGNVWRVENFWPVTRHSRSKRSLWPGQVSHGGDIGCRCLKTCLLRTKRRGWCCWFVEDSLPQLPRTLRRCSHSSRICSRELKSSPPSRLKGNFGLCEKQNQSNPLS